MARNSKILSCALVVTLSLCSVATSIAQAGEFMIDEGTSEIVAEGETQKFSTTSGTIECGEAQFVATSFNSSEVTSNNILYRNSPAETTCKGVFGTHPEIVTKGCHFTATPGPTEELGNFDMTTGEVHLGECTEGGIVVNAPGCTITIPNGQTLGDVTFHTTTGLIDHTHTFYTSLFEYTHEGFLCGTGEGSNGTYNGSFTARAFDSEGNQVSFTVT